MYFNIGSIFSALIVPNLAIIFKQPLSKSLIWVAKRQSVSGILRNSFNIRETGIYNCSGVGSFKVLGCQKDTVWRAWNCPEFPKGTGGRTFCGGDFVSANGICEVGEVGTGSDRIGDWIGEAGAGEAGDRGGVGDRKLITGCGTKRGGGGDATAGIGKEGDTMTGIGMSLDGLGGTGGGRGGGGNGGDWGWGWSLAM